MQKHFFVIQRPLGESRSPLCLPWWSPWPVCPQATSAQGSSLRLRDLSGRKLVLWSITKNCSISIKRLEPQKTRARLELTQPEGSKASGHRGQLLTFYSHRCQVDLIGKARTDWGQLVLGDQVYGSIGRILKYFNIHSALLLCN